MRMVIVVAIMGGIHNTKPCWGAMMHSLTGPTDLYVIDNTGKDEGQGQFFDRFIKPQWPGDVRVDRMPSNIGVVRSLQKGYQETGHDIVAYIHNDVYIYDHGWDGMIKDLFVSPDTGLVGFFGAEQVVPDGHRGYVYSNMLEAEIHGGRLGDRVIEVAVLDGLSMIASRKMLDERCGVDLEYDVHHFYDLDLSLESIDRGYRNYVAPVHIHHHSGQTACQPIFQEWANKYVGVAEKGENMLYKKNLARFMKKWQDYLPWRVGERPWGKRQA